jgi:hypothetical protein
MQLHINFFYIASESSFKKNSYVCRCEAFSTYPRTYDLIHANGVLSMYQDR